MTSTSENIYSDANNTPPISQAVPLGLQHVLAMFASNVTPSIIVAGAAGLAGLMKCIKEKSLENLRNHIGLSSDSRILVFNTEGDTDKESFKSLIKN